MASLINPPLLDKTGKEIVAELTGETVQPSASQYNAPISDATGKAILEAIKKGGGGSGVLYVNIIEKTRNMRSVETDQVLDKTYKEIADAIAANKSVIAKTTLFSDTPQLMPLIQYGYLNGVYGVVFADISNSSVLVYGANAEDGEMKRIENP